MLHEIRLGGLLAEKYGESFKFHIGSAREAVWALTSQLEGIRDDLLEGAYTVRVSNSEAEYYVESASLDLGLGNGDVLWIEPQVQGGGPFAVAAVIAAVVVVAVAFQPEIPDFAQNDNPDERPSFLFNNIVNTNTQGSAIPLVYGRTRTGSIVASSGISTEDFE